MKNAKSLVFLRASFQREFRDTFATNDESDINAAPDSGRENRYENLA